MAINKESGSVIVSWDFSNGKDNRILLVGVKETRGGVDVVNAFSGDEAEELMKKLTIQNYGKGPVVG